MRVCTLCKTEKPLADFYPDRSKKSGRMARCSDCSNALNRARRKRQPEKERERNRNRYWKNRDAERERHTIRKYGITLKRYDEMLMEQGGNCAICAAPATKTLDIDHDHLTGHVRGLLCTSCNRMIGHAGDDPERLSKAAAYLILSRKLRRNS